MSQLPKTQARLATSIKIYATTKDLDFSDINSIKEITSKVGSGDIKVLASVTKLDEKNTRPATARYEIDADKPGEIVERIPQLVDRTLTLEKVVLYSEDALSGIGQINGADLIDQTKPFTIIKVEWEPSDDPSGKSVSSITMYTGCWFTSNPKTYNVGGGNIHIIQSVEVAYAKRFYQKF